MTAAALVASACGDDSGVVTGTDGDGAEASGTDDGAAAPDDDDGDGADGGDSAEEGVCGDGRLNAVIEECDGSDFGALTCAGFGAAGGSLSCNADCTIDTCSCDWDDGGCEAPDAPECGNFVRDFEEECDGNDYGADEDGPLGPPTCAEMLGEGYFGEVTCTDCAIDTSQCGTCGDGVVDDEVEACEPGDPVPCAEVVPGQPFGDATCTDACEWNVDACLAPSADVLISELMIVPLNASDVDEGEWIEVHNLDDAAPIDLQDCTVTSSSGVQSFAVEGELLVAPLGFATFGRGSDTELGFTPDHPIPEGFDLADADDSVQLVCGGVVLDEVVYDLEMPWPTSTAGTAIATVADTTPADNDDGASWCAASTEYAAGRFGTPGAANDCG